jgi:exopolyphosphatase / guanosine-5'-triphosphate,3'-diphosphate pyrophosphatase
MKITKIAAIDIGSNAVRFLVNDIYENGDNPLFNKETLIRVPIRLGKDVFSSGKISGYNINRLADALNAFKLLINVFQVDDYMVYGTSALREAENALEVIEMIKERTDITIELIQGEQEAELILNNKQLEVFLLDNKDYLYVDVGGGSTDICFFNKIGEKKSKSFKIGTVRFLEEKVEESHINEMRIWVKETTKGKSVELIGSGGNINHVRRRFFEIEKEKISYTELNEKYKEVKQMTIEERIKNFQMKADRADVIEPALQIYTSIMKWADAKYIHVPKIGVSDGMIQYLYNKNRILN